MLELRPLDLSRAGIERTCRLLNLVFPEARHVTPGYLERLYGGNPLGETFGLSAFHAGELVGHLVMIPIRARLHGAVETGIFPFQLATHPGHRLKGLFASLVEQSIAVSRERGYTFWAGVGNANSTPILVRRGFQAIRQLDVKIGFGPAPPPGDDAKLDLLRLWDREGIAWRLGHPARPYRATRRPDGVRLYADSGHLGVPVQVGHFPEELLPADLERLRTPNPLRLWIGADPTRDWSRSPYVDVPRRFWPSPLNLLFYDLGDPPRTFDPERVRYEVFDFDAY